MPSSPQTGGSRRGSRKDGDGRSKSTISNSHGRKGSNQNRDIDDKRRQSLSKDAAGKSSKSKSKDLRKGTNASALSSRTGRSATSSMDDDSTDSEVDLNTLPNHLRKAVPLHLVEARILKKSEIQRTGVTTPGGKIIPRRVGTYTEDIDEIPDADPDPPPIHEVYVDKLLLWLGIVLFLIWCLTIVPLLAIHALTFHLSLADDMHRTNADAVLLKLEADLIKEFTPVANAVGMVVLQAASRMFQTAQPYEAVTRSIASNIQESKRLQYVQVVNAAERMVVVRPGNVHYVPKDEDGDGYIDVLIAPDKLMAYAEVLPDTACQGQDAFLCFQIDDLTRLRTVKKPNKGLGQDGSWLGPEFLTKGKDGQSLEDTKDWPLVTRFLSHVNASASLSLGLDVAIGLEGAQNIILESTPADGALFLFTVEGEILAGTDWAATPLLDPALGKIAYQKIWDLPYEWAQSLTLQDIQSEERQEFWTTDRRKDRGLVVWKALGLCSDHSSQSPGSGGCDLLVEASRSAMRMIVLMPRQTAVRNVFTQAVNGAIGIILVPVLCGILLLLWWCLQHIVRRCRAGYCRCCCCRKKQDDFPWIVEGGEEF